MEAECIALAGLASTYDEGVGMPLLWNHGGVSQSALRIQLLQTSVVVVGGKLLPIGASHEVQAVSEQSVLSLIISICLDETVHVAQDWYAVSIDN